MKKIIISTFALLSATAASAGSIVFTAPEVISIEEPARMGGSGAWLIPLIIAAVVLLAVTNTPASTPATTPTTPNPQN